MIPKVIFQTAKDPLPQYVIDQFKARCPDFTYLFFSDADILEFFKMNPLDDFPEPERIFYQFHDGAHRADFFRYYYLFVKGGVYIDCDAMVYTDLTTVCENFDYFSVDSCVFPQTIFQGVIGSVPQNLILYRALQTVYHVPPHLLMRDYYLFIKDMYRIIKSKDIEDMEYRIKLYREIEDGDRALVADNDNRVCFIHFWKNKTIPERVV